MNIRRILAVAAIPFTIGTFGFVAPNQANAQSPANRKVEIQRPRQQNELQKPDKKPQIKHHQQRPQNKKRPSQPQSVNQNRIPNNNR
ncbi:MAG: hypothetical protein RMY28_018830 [Nostoc sp. ChiSLP01]|nr:hypothetical protein [Nostoc sp. CmiSLP01]MDZ8287227.1 hypothetical protein [Nostoc sp. ChiSLP01]